MADIAFKEMASLPIAFVPAIHTLIDAARPRVNSAGQT
jgi:hypothetical protein